MDSYLLFRLWIVFSECLLRRSTAGIRDVPLIKNIRNTHEQWLGKYRISLSKRIRTSIRGFSFLMCCTFKSRIHQVFNFHVSWKLFVAAIRTAGSKKKKSST